MKAIVKRELKALFGSLRGWGYMAIVLLGAAIATLITNVLGGASRFELNAGYIALAYIPATALATMGSFGAEKSQNTRRLLYSLPLKNRSIVLGKLLALMGPVLATGVVLCLFPAFLSLYGLSALPAALSAVLALTALGAACMAVGLLVSSCARNQGVAFLTTVATLALSWAAPYLAERLSAAAFNLYTMISLVLIVFALTWLLSNSGVLSVILAAGAEVPLLLCYLRGTGALVMKALGKAVNALSLFGRLEAFVNGLLDGRVIIYYLTVVALFAVFTVLSVRQTREAKRRAL